MKHDGNWISDDWITEAIGCPYKIIDHKSMSYVQGPTELEDLIDGQEYHVEWDVILPKDFKYSDFQETEEGNLFSSKKGDILVVYRSANIDNKALNHAPFILIDIGEGQYKSEYAESRSYHRIK
jgi:hypothetical protein